MVDHQSGNGDHIGVRIKGGEIGVDADRAPVDTIRSGHSTPCTDSFDRNINGVFVSLISIRFDPAEPYPELRITDSHALEND